MRFRLVSFVAFSLTAIALTTLSAPATTGNLYKWTDERGRVHYTSTPPPESARNKAVFESKKLSKINALPNYPSKDRADGSGSPTDDFNVSERGTPYQTASSDQNFPTSSPALIPAELLPPSNTPATAKPEQPAQPDIVEVVAQGMGIDANAALLNAYSNAVQQALGLYVDAETMVQNDEIVRDKILTYSKGFIQEASEISKSQTNGLFQVNIRAKVKRQQLLEQAKANNISMKAVDGTSLHAKVMSQIKQEQDAKQLLEKALLPLVDKSFHRAELVPSNKEQPNPTINKSDTDSNFVTLDYKVYLFIDEQEYFKYLKNKLIPILDRIAENKKDNITVTYQQSYFLENNTKQEKGLAKIRPSEKNYFSLNVLYWKDKSLASSKWKSYAILKDFLSKDLIDKWKNAHRVNIDLSLLDQEEPVALGNIENYNCHGNLAFGCSILGGAADEFSFFLMNMDRLKAISIAPYFGVSSGPDGRIVLPPKSIYVTISVKISKEDLPRVRSAKLEVKPAGER